MKKIIVNILFAVLGLLAAAGILIGILFGVVAIKTNNMNKDYAYLKEDLSYSQRVEVTGLNLVTQHVSCGYATIEMLSEFYGTKVTEDDLDNKNDGRVSTSSTDGFLNEINDSIKHQNFIKKTYLSNDNYLKQIYRSLEKNNPVAIEWAAEYKGEWTLHFSIVSALDLVNDEVVVYNPYGIVESLDVATFINRTSFKAYKNMPIFLQFGFAFGAFHKNTLFYAL